MNMVQNQQSKLQKLYMDESFIEEDPEWGKVGA